jgi:hypothetical protein
LKALGRFRKPAILLLLGCLVGFHPVWRYQLPRSSEAWSHLENLDRIPSATEALRIGRMLDLFGRRQHYPKYPLFYVAAKAAQVNSPLRAAVFSAVVFSILPVLMFLLARSVFDELTAFVAAVLVAVASSFVYTMNFFSGGEPLAVAVMLVALILHLRYRPVLALPLYLIVLLLHPYASLFLWVFLLVLPLASDPGRPSRERNEEIACAGVFSLAFLGWMLFQISAGLPLGDLIAGNLPALTLSAALLGTAGAALVAAALRVRVGSLEALLGFTVGSFRRYLHRLLLPIEVAVLALLMVAGAPGTEQVVTLSAALFHLPLIAAVALASFRGREAETLTTAFTLALLVVFAAGMVLPEGVPVYRLAPYASIALALLLAPLVRRPRARWALPFLVGGMAMAAYPGPPFGVADGERDGRWESSDLG